MLERKWSVIEYGALESIVTVIALKILHQCIKKIEKVI